MPVIEFADVSKRFNLHRDKPKSFQDLFLSLAGSLTHARQLMSQSNVFWALRNLTCSIEAGESIGLVGSNGAGKSTMLKLIARIISATSGEVRSTGRVTALLELGAGFHPELTGRDNIYLNGAIMGLGRRALSSKLDQIIDFAEISEFIDTPVKNYSSGMHARLGFAISVFLDPKILLVDEALAVGDQSFQQKCLEQMQHLRRDGVTIVMVSHALDTVPRMCSRALWLDHGKLVMDAPSSQVVDAYYKRVLEQSSEHHVDTWAPSRTGSGEARLTRVQFLGADLKPCISLRTFDPLIVRLHYKCTQRIPQPVFGLGFYRADSQIHLAGPNSGFSNIDIPYIENEGWMDFKIPSVAWLAGDVVMHVVITDRGELHKYDYWHECGRVTIVPGGTFERFGVMATGGEWSLGRASET